MNRKKVPFYSMRYLSYNIWLRDLHDKEKEHIYKHRTTGTYLPLHVSHMPPEKEKIFKILKRGHAELHGKLSKQVLKKLQQAGYRTVTLQFSFGCG